MIVDVIIPALNEEQSLPKVLAEIPRARVRRVVVADNGSSDRTCDVARASGAEVVFENQRGYGAACLRAIDHLRSNPPEVVVFLDGDYSDHPDELPRLLLALTEGVDLVIGSRTRGSREAGSLTPQQIVGNRFATALLALLYGVHYTDLGPFRAIRWQSLERLQMTDRGYGWTMEMQIKAARHRMQHREVPVSYRRRIGVSKISGTVRGTVGASYKIVATLLRYAWPRA